MDFHQQRVHKKPVKTLVAMEGRCEHDPSMARDHPATACLARFGATLRIENATFRASAISPKRILYETSFQHAC